MELTELYHIYLETEMVCTDTRKITKNCLFFALKGDNFNGNSYAKEALEKGAAYAVVDEIEYAESDRYILVDDVLETLQKLATYHRKKNKAKVIGLTGSNGKTTTKELINAVLSRTYKTIATKGNLNNHIGVPLTLLSIKPDTEIAIVEMGANHVKEIEFLCNLSQPDFGYITNFGKAHLEGFGSEEGVIKGKSELYEHLIANGNHLFMNADDPIQFKKLSTYIKKFGFSTDKTDYYTIEFLGADPFVKMGVEGLTIESKLVGSYNFGNCAAAILIGKYFNVPLKEIKSALENYVPNNNRSQFLDMTDYRILLDAYNANPTSMKAALVNFNQMEAASKIVFLGDMFELGVSAQMEHQKIADYVSEINLTDAFLIGENFNKTRSPYKKFKNFEVLKEYLKENPIAKNSTILIKGSRGMALERILDLL